MPTDPTPTAADVVRWALAKSGLRPDEYVHLTLILVEVLATARRDADAAGYARAVEESAALRRMLDILGMRASAKLAAAAKADLTDEDNARIAAFIAEWRRNVGDIYRGGRAEGLREAAAVCESSATACAAVNSAWDNGRAACARQIRALASPPTPEPTPLCSSCGDSGSVPTGAYDETEERDERVACPACDGDGGGAPEPTPGPRSCNRHTDCDAADRDAKAHGKPLGADHCHDDTCEDCFGD